MGTLVSLLAAAEMVALPHSSLSMRRPRIAMDFAPASAKAPAISLPIPVAPPVTTMFLPQAESSGRGRSMNWYGSAREVLVKLETRRYRWEVYPYVWANSLCLTVEFKTSGQASREVTLL
jgi:hypothetical protein